MKYFLILALCIAVLTGCAIDFETHTLIKTGKAARSGGTVSFAEITPTPTPEPVSTPLLSSRGVTRDVSVEDGEGLEEPDLEEVFLDEIVDPTPQPVEIVPSLDVSEETEDIRAHA